MGSGISNLYQNARQVMLYPGSIDYMPPGDKFSESIRKRKDVDANGFYDVIAHGTQKTVLIEHHGKQVEISHRTLARVLENNPEAYGKRGIRLLSCSTGKIPHGFAQGLADKLGVPVIAPNDYLWVDNNGRYFVAAGQRIGGKFVADINKRGKFVTYFPQKRSKK